MFDWLRKRRQATKPQEAAPAQPDKHVPMIDERWDRTGAPVIEPMALALMDDDTLEAAIEGFDDSVEEFLMQMQPSQQNYAALVLAYLSTLEAAKELATRQQPA